LRGKRYEIRRRWEGRETLERDYWQKDAKTSPFKVLACVNTPLERRTTASRFAECRAEKGRDRGIRRGGGKILGERKKKMEGVAGNSFIGLPYQ